MQLLINRSKFLIFAVLSCSLLIGMLADNFQVKDFGYLNTDEISSIRPVDYVWNSMRRQLQLVPESTSPFALDTSTGGSVWNELSDEFKLDHKADSARVQAEIRKLLADPNQLYNILKAAEPYIYFIHKQTKERGLPAELALIPVIESEFNPNDHSNKGATGLWQLMPATAQELGIKIKSHYDGRRNVVASTHAALAYFNDLGNYFNGNWYLAIAAYNCGQVKVQHAERRSGSHSYWNLPLPQETKYYVPKLLAVAEIIKNPKKYGVELPSVNNTPYFTEMKLKKSVDLDHMAKTSGISVDTMHALNPDFNHGMVSVKGGSYSVLVPIDKASQIERNLGTNVVTS